MTLKRGKAAARGGDGAAEFFGGFDPFLNDDVYVGQGRVPHTPILRVGFLTFPLWRLGQALALARRPRLASRQLENRN